MIQRMEQVSFLTTCLTKSDSHTVAYQDRPSAESDGLAKIENGIATIRVDARQDLPVGQGRPSVRLHSKETFKHGQLLVFDGLSCLLNVWIRLIGFIAKQAPYGCGVWPGEGALPLSLGRIADSFEQLSGLYAPDSAIAINLTRATEWT